MNRQRERNGVPRVKWIKFGLLSALTAVVAIVLSIQFGAFELRRLAARVDELEQQKAHLIEYARRLAASRRVAQVTILDQHLEPPNHAVTTLRWQEIGPDGVLGEPLTRKVLGRIVYFEALVMKFTATHVGEGDPARGASLALFRRVFGDAQAPESGPEIGRTARPPHTGISAGDPNRALQDRMWSMFWQFVDDPRVAEQYGVRVAQIEAPALPAVAGETWEVSVDALGGVNLRKLSSIAGP